MLRINDAMITGEKGRKRRRGGVEMYSHPFNADSTELETASYVCNLSKTTVSYLRTYPKRFVFALPTSVP